MVNSRPNTNNVCWLGDKHVVKEWCCESFGHRNSKISKKFTVTNWITLKKLNFCFVLINKPLLLSWGGQPILGNSLGIFICYNSFFHISLVPSKSSQIAYLNLWLYLRTKVQNTLKAFPCAVDFLISSERDYSLQPLLVTPIDPNNIKLINK